MDSNTLESINATAGDADAIAQAAADSRKEMLTTLRTALARVETARARIVTALGEYGDAVEAAPKGKGKAGKVAVKAAPRKAKRSPNGEITEGIMKALGNTREMSARDVIAAMEKAGYKSAGSSVYVRLNAMVDRGDLKSTGKRHARTYRKA